MASSPNEPYSAVPQNPFESPRTALESAPVDYQRNLMWLLFSFKGRINRAPFWGGSLGVFAVYMLIVFGLSAVTREDSPAGLLLLPVFAVYIWAMLAIQIKRWHDRDKSGWWVLIGIIPLVGAIWQLVEVGCLPGTPGPNSYGPDPLA